MFRMLALIAAPALALSGCAMSALEPLPANPAEVANATALDEKAALGAELAYQAFRTSIELAVDAGLLKGERAARVAELDVRAYHALTVARAAYEVGNAETYASALETTRSTIREALELIKGN